MPEFDFQNGPYPELEVLYPFLCRVGGRVLVGESFVHSKLGGGWWNIMTATGVPL